MTLLSIIFFPLRSESQEMEPRNYSSVPVGLNVAVLSYSYSTGDIVADASSPIKELDLSSNTVAIGYLRSFGLFGKLCKIQVGIPYVFLDGNAKLNGRDTSGTRSGLADSRIKFVFDLIGARALAPKEFVKHKEKFVFGTSLSVSVPTGQYYEDKLINLGSNRWGFKPEIGASYNTGPLFFELFTGVWLFTKNSDFLETNTVQQDPIFSLQGHISYLFPSKIWVALNSVYVNGGETKLNNVNKNDFQSNFRTGVTLSVPINMNNSIKANFSKGVATRAGGDFTIYSLTYQYMWF
ncbi:MAG TPA: transporter [Ignavibacteria bacterium]|nr:transporter [Ignavibacteria bacterium]